MTKRMKMGIALGLVAGLGACGSKASGVDKIMADYTAAKNTLCACTDKACADKAKAAADDVERAARQSGVKPTKEQEATFEAIEDEINACARKF
jgi:hypothetical protein